MPGQEHRITDDGSIEIITTRDDGTSKTVRLDCGVDDELLDIRARSTGGMEFEFPDGDGGRLVLAFVPDLSVPELSVQAGRPGNLVELAVLTP